MKTKRPIRLTYANVVASLALFAALGGASYAAATLPKNSVGRAQLKNNAVVSKKVKDHSLLARDFKKGQLPAGPQGPKGDPGAPGKDGVPGPAGRSALAPLKAGETESGVFAVGGPSSGAGNSHIAGVTFPIPLSHSLDLAHTIAVDGAPSATHCPGQGQADPGFLCVYVNYRGAHMNPLTSPYIGNPGQPPSSGADTRGFDVSGTANSATSFDAIVGTWTYTEG